LYDIYGPPIDEWLAKLQVVKDKKQHDYYLIKIQLRDIKKYFKENAFPRKSQGFRARQAWLERHKSDLLEYHTKSTKICYCKGESFTPRLLESVEDSLYDLLRAPKIAKFCLLAIFGGWMDNGSCENY